MPYRFLRDERPGAGLRRMLCEQVAKAQDDLAESDLHRGVHQARKRLKKIRAVVRLFRGAAPELYTRVNDAARAVAREMGSTREAGARIECFDELAAAAPLLTAEAAEEVREVLVAERDGLLVQLDATALRAQAQAGLAALPGLVSADELAEFAGWKAIAKGLRKTYHRGRTALAAVADADEPDAEAVHEWRKRTKNLRYQLQTLRDCWRPVLDAVAAELDELGDLLGHHHDLADLLVRLDDHQAPALGGVETRRVLREAIHRQGAECLERALLIGRRAWAESAKRLDHRLRAYWRAWRSSNAPAFHDH